MAITLQFMYMAKLKLIIKMEKKQKYICFLMVLNYKTMYYSWCNTECLSKWIRFEIFSCRYIWNYLGRAVLATTEKYKKPLNVEVDPSCPSVINDQYHQPNLLRKNVI